MERRTNSSSRRTVVICVEVKGLPNMTLLRQARLANILRALEGRTISPDGLDLISSISSSKSAKGEQSQVRRAHFLRHGLTLNSKDGVLAHRLR